MDARSITVDKNNKVWVGTRYKGVFCFTFNDMVLTSVEQFTTSHGLTDNFIYTLNCDNNNTVWVGTQTGLDKIFRKNGQYIIGNVSKSNNFFQTIFKITNEKDNTVWALTSEGSILKVSPASSVKLSPAPPLLLTSVLVNDKRWDNNITRFSYRENNLVFTVAAPSFIDERSIRYSYMLEGSANNTWSRPSNNASFNFINLSPGNYTLNMRADFPDGMYPAQTLSYSFNIRPPWWQTWWFLSLMGLFFIGLLILGVRSYYRSKLEKQRMILEKQQAIEKERTRIASDMHDDLGAGLSTIRFLSEKVKRNSFSEVTKNDADKIVVNSNELVQKMNEIIWAMNEKNDTLEDLLFYTRSYAVEYCEENGLQCNISLPENIPALFVSGEIRRNVFLTVKESLHNVVKHANAKKVTIGVNVGKGLSVTISDDGTGLTEKEESDGNGLRNMKKRIESVNGTFAILNTNGVTISMVIPLIV